MRRLPPGRLTGWRPGARHVLEAEAGRFAAWGVAPGTCLGTLPRLDRPNADGPQAEVSAGPSTWSGDTAPSSSATTAATVGDAPSMRSTKASRRSASS